MITVVLAIWHERIPWTIYRAVCAGGAARPVGPLPLSSIPAGNVRWSVADNIPGCCYCRVWMQMPFGREEYTCCPYGFTWHYRRAVRVPVAVRAHNKRTGCSMPASSSSNRAELCQCCGQKNLDRAHMRSPRRILHPHNRLTFVRVCRGSPV